MQYNSEVRKEEVKGIIWRTYFLGQGIMFADSRSKAEGFRWKFEANGESFDYYTGHGHATPLYNQNGKLNKKPIDKKCLRTINAWVPIPELRDLLDCLFSDSSACEEGFDDWCSSLGYDTDSRSALDTYLACQRNAVKLRKVLGKEYESTRDEINGVNDL